MSKKEKTADTAAKLLQIADNATLEERKAELDGLVKDVNAAIIARSADLTAKKELMAECLVVYNTQLREAEYDKWLTDEEPLTAALLQSDVEQCKLKLLAANPDKEIAHDNYVVEECVKLVNLLEFDEYQHKTTKQTLFVRDTWQYEAEVLAKYLAMRIADDVENASNKSDIDANFKLSKEAVKTQSDDREANPISNTSLKSMCQFVIDGITSNGYKFTNKDLKYLLFTMTRKGKGRSTLAAPRVTTVIDLITEIVCTLANKRAYSVEFKAKEAGKSTKTTTTKGKADSETTFVKTEVAA